MAESPNKLLNPSGLLLHFQKLGLELKCPLCLNLLNRPVLLPCDHVFCGLCITRSSEAVSECSVCKQPYADRDVRPAPYMESLVTIYKSSHATFSNTGRVTQQSPPPINTFVDNGLKELPETPQDGNSSNRSLTMAERLQALINQSVEGRSKLTQKFESDKSTPPISSKEQCGKFEEPETEGMNVNHVLKSSPGPPSFDFRVREDDPGDPVSSTFSTRKHPAETMGLVEDNSDKRGGETNNSTSPGTPESDARDSKRRKKSNHGSFDTEMKSNGCTQPNVLQSEFVATSKLESQLGELSGERLPKILDSRDKKRSRCAFCQTADLTDITGPMLHYDKGKEVKGHRATKANVIHVHKTCIEWTPQVYFIGETIKKLKEEVARAAKLKCSRCGLRGAPLGCFEKSCRKSYHVPCAVKIDDCRWDVEDFLVLCPSHSFVKFPREKAQLGKHASEKQNFVATEITSKQSNFWGDKGMKKWVFCGSALSAEEKYLLVKFAGICGATVTKFWKPNVTHVVAATDANGACSRTFKVLKAILHGRWILKTDWIKACMEAMHPVDEEPYEVSLDNHGHCDGPKTGRLRALGNVPKLFNGLDFYFSGDFEPDYKEDLLDLVITAGGTVNEIKEQLLAPSHEAQATPSVSLVVYNNECRQDDEGSIVFKRRGAAENLAHEIGSKVIAHTWLLESMAAHELQPLAF
ncbi:BRCA1-associated RING domain protein 1-like isoform X2 [Rhododendron vialii]|uniref:BRCA1-associated RING domain protein 1-like isoform X2 n=1 Tax=Rhododendron vialii TaxID=182163 RepID=UPI00265F7DC0|nr:BRCA1-associated RING domain protein 1-like isoform X2 [Rhododendron vialii]